MSTRCTSEANLTELDRSLTGSVLHFASQSGARLETRTEPFWTWIRHRRTHEVWPFFRVLGGGVSHRVEIADEFGKPLGSCINFGSQDYLGLAQAESLRDAVRESLPRFGVHSAGSPALCGRTRPLLQLERRIADLLHREACLIYPTGWAAGFGVVGGLVRREDTIIIDALAHNCLQEGARHATAKVTKFPHNNLRKLRLLLQEARQASLTQGIFVIIESLYSMDSDSPNLGEAIALAREFEAILILDVAHDLGAIGSRGLGLLETIDLGTGPDLIMGSFSKTFAANGGFVACSQSVRTYLGCYSAPLGFSNAISPLQTAVVNRAFEIVFSPVGQMLREQLWRNILTLRGAMEQRGLILGGTPSPICPVFVGDEPLARLTAKHLVRGGLLANLVEFPAVAKGKARFRFQVMATHTAEEIESAALIMTEARQVASAELREFQKASSLPLASQLTPASSVT